MRKIFIYGFLFLVITINLVGQSNTSLYYLKNLPQSNYLNPALEPKCTFFLGLPGLYSTYIDVDNSLRFNDILFKGQGTQADSLITIFHPSYNIDDFLSKLDDKSFISSEFQTNVFAIGLKVPNGFFTFAISDRVTTNFNYPKDLLKLATQGNVDGETFDFSGFGTNITYFREYAMGLSQSFQKWTFGVRGKLLFGKANASTRIHTLLLNTTREVWELRADVDANVSGPLEVTRNAENEVDDVGIRDMEGKEVAEFFMKTKNLGLGVDMGAVYHYDEKFTFSASLVDLGYIRWKDEVYNFTLEGQYDYTGINYNPEDYDNVGDAAEAVADTIKDSFTLTDEITPYTTGLTPKLYVGASMELTKVFNAGFLSRTHLNNKKVYQSFTLSANANLNHFLTTTLNYSLGNNGVNGLGLGLAMRGGPFQFYVISDKVPTQYQKDVDSNMPIPYKANGFNVRFGLNLVFGCNRERKMNQDPMILSW